MDFQSSFYKDTLWNTDIESFYWSMKNLSILILQGHSLKPVIRCYKTRGKHCLSILILQGHSLKRKPAIGAGSTWYLSILILQGHSLKHKNISAR